MNYKLIENIVFDGVFHDDYPDYCDAYILSAEYNGEPMTEEQLNVINEDSTFVYQKLIEHLQ